MNKNKNRASHIFCASILTIGLATSLGLISHYFSPMDNYVKGKVYELIEKNPEVIVAAFKSAQDKARLNGSAITAEMAEKAHQNLGGYVKGPEDAVVKVTEFFDPNCGYCRKAVSEFQEVQKQFPDVRFAVHEYPVISPASPAVSRLSLGVLEQGKYEEFHKEISELRGTVDEVLALEIAEKLELDMDKLDEDRNALEVSKTVAQTLDLGQSLNIRATPTFIINDRMYPRVIPAEELTKIIKEEISSSKNGK